MDHRSMFRSRRSVKWIEKYRPKELSDVKYREEEVREFEKAVRSNERHILLCGPWGTGKTSTVLALARKLFGPDLYQSRVLRLQVGDRPNPNIDFTKTIEAFIEANDDCGDQHQRCPPHMIILIENSEHMMTPNCRFKDKVLEIIGNPSKTKGALFIFETFLTPPFTQDQFYSMTPLSSICKALCFECTELEVRSYLEEICVKEELSIDEQAMPSICFNARGSPGMALVYLQEFARSFRQTVGLEDCNNGFMRFERETVSSFFDASREGDPQKVMCAVEKIFSEPCDISMFISQLYDMVCELDITEKQLNVDENMTKRGHDDTVEDCQHLLFVASSILRAFDRDSVETVKAFWRVFGEADIHGRWDD